MKHNSKLVNWTKRNLTGLFTLNLLLMILVLLHSAGYFHPFVPLSINFIVLITICLSVLLIGLRSKHIVVIILFFWIFSGLLEMLGVNIWAERSAIYVYEGLLVATVCVFFERKNKIERDG